MTREQMKERNLKIVEDYKSGMEVKVIAIKYNISKCMISHIIKPLDIPKGRYRTSSGRCVNHPDREAVKHTRLCLECKRAYMRAYMREQYRKHYKPIGRNRKQKLLPKPVPVYVREELPPRLEALRQKYKNLDRFDLQGISVRLSDFDYTAQPKLKYSGMIWR